MLQPDPEKPVVHAHVNVEAPVEVHVPPLAHGKQAHAFITETNKRSIGSNVHQNNIWFQNMDISKLVHS